MTHIHFKEIWNSHKQKEIAYFVKNPIPIVK